MPSILKQFLCVSIAACLLGGLASAQSIKVNGREYPSREAYYRSAEFRSSGARCGTAVLRFLRSGGQKDFGSGTDCSATSTNPDAGFDPGEPIVIPVVVHIIQDTLGNGVISDETVQSQIDVLNEDFQALTGTPGQSGSNAAIQFALAMKDPCGAPTTGITRSTDDSWFADEGNYWETLAWDPNRYMNIYTNNPGGVLGYVPFLPADGPFVGERDDRVVINWNNFGRDSAGGPPYNQGRTATHEVGHYLGLDHPFSGGCASAASPACYADGDLICDTLPLGEEQFGCPTTGNSCGDPDPYTNYMNYTDDTCMTGFSVEQIRRMRCSLEHYRSGLRTTVGEGEGAGGGVAQCEGEGEGILEGEGEGVLEGEGEGVLEGEGEGGVEPECIFLQPGLEDGGTAWTSTSTNFDSSICDIAVCGDDDGTVGPRNGSHFVWFGGAEGAAETGTLFQSIVIPNTGVATLEFYLWNGGVSNNGTDNLVVSVDGNNLLTIQDGDPAYTSGYAKVTVDISAYADGAAHAVLLTGNFSGPDNCNMSMDDLCIITANAEGEAEGVLEGQGEGVLEGEGESGSDYESLLANFSDADVDQDSLITLAEGQVQVPGFTQQELEDADANGDGKLSVGELLQYVGGGILVNADTNGDSILQLAELLRLIQLYNAGLYACAENAGATEDGFSLSATLNEPACVLHSVDQNGDKVISLSELLRGIQLFNFAGYSYCDGQSEDNFCDRL